MSALSGDTPSAKDKALPLLRRDVRIYKGPDDPDGSPTYNCLDPVSAQYYKITWAEMVILQRLRPSLTLSELTKELNQESTLKVTEQEVASFFEEAAQNNLLTTIRPSEVLVAEKQKKQMNPILWTLYHYLYIRVPILNPDAFLAKTLRYVRPLVSTPALFLYFVLIFSGLFMLIDRFSQFLSTFPYFFNLQGIISYAAAISIVKVIHEFSHAYVAKYYRLHVPTMGIAFIVLWPVLYTDVTDGWKLNKRSHRLAISIAGVAAELVLAGLATLGWSLTKPGMLQSVFFVVASATWISTLLVNLNPAMRFDGYYLMCDLAGIDNLQPRAFAYTRWQLRKWLLGINVPPPEEGVSVRRRAFMFSYSIYTWIYRLVLYTVIALFVYHEFTKALGILLFAVEIAFFIAPPFVSEAKQLRLMAPLITFNIRSILTTFLAALLAFWFIFPLPHRAHFPGMTIAAENQMIYIPQEGEIKAIFFQLGQTVHKDDILIALNSDPLEIEIKGTQAQIEIIKAELHTLSLKAEERAYLPEKTAELAAAEAKLKTLLQQRNLLTIKAAINGTVYQKDENIRPEQHVYKNQVVGQIGTVDHIEVICFVPESKLDYVTVGQRASFRLSNTLKTYQGKISKIAPIRTGTLVYPQMASLYKGDLPVVEAQDKKSLLMVESYFLVRMQLDHQDPSLRIGERGHLTIFGPWRSLLFETLRYIQSLFWQESGF